MATLRKFTHFAFKCRFCIIGVLLAAICCVSAYMAGSFAWDAVSQSASGEGMWMDNRRIGSGFIENVGHGADSGLDKGFVFTKRGADTPFPEIIKLNAGQLGASIPDSQTGDTVNLPLWLSLLCTSFIGLIILAVYWMIKQHKFYRPKH